MTPAKRRPATPASQGPKRATPEPEVPIVADPPPTAPTAPPPTPEVPIVADVPTAETKDDTQLLGPDGEPVAQEAPTGDASGDSAPPTKTGQVDPEDRATTQSPGRSRALFPGRVWPD
jgi:hypothetical protein